MSITNYSELQTAVATWLHRTDLTSVIPDLISLAEQRMDALVRSRQMDVTTTLSATGGTATVALPTDMLEMRRAMIATDPVQILQYLTPDQITTEYPSATTSKPVAFTIIGENMELAPTPDSDYSISLTYSARIPRLSGTNTSNWLLENNANAYLFGALCEAAPFLVNDERIQVWEGKFQDAINGVNQVDWYSGSTMRVRTV
jgi:hypothetical protein